MSETKFTPAPWKDETTYSRGDTQKIPSSWKLKEGLISISVHRHIHYPGVWLLSCPAFGIEKKVLKAKEVEAAKEEAILAVKSKLYEMIASCERLLGR